MRLTTEVSEAVNPPASPTTPDIVDERDGWERVPGAWWSTSSGHAYMKRVDRDRNDPDDVPLYRPAALATPSTPGAGQRDVAQRSAYQQAQDGFAEIMRPHEHWGTREDCDVCGPTGNERHTKVNAPTCDLPQPHAAHNMGGGWRCNGEAR